MALPFLSKLNIGYADAATIASDKFLMRDSAGDVQELTLTGSPSALTFLAGDGSWSAPVDTVLKRASLRTSDATNFGSLTHQAIDWADTADFIDTDVFTHSTGTNPSRLEVEEDGVYDLKATIGWTTNQTGQRMTMEAFFKVNGTTNYLTTTNRSYNRGTTYGNSTTEIQATISLSANDYVEVFFGVDIYSASYTCTIRGAETEFTARLATTTAVGNTWRPMPALNEITDVVLTGAADNDLLVRSGGNWIDTAGGLTWSPNNQFKIETTPVAVSNTPFASNNDISGQTGTNSFSGFFYEVTETGRTSSSGAFFLRFRKNLAETFQLTLDGEIIAAPNTDLTTILGRTAIHATTTDRMMISHYDQRTSGSKFALMQESGGKTILNSATGQSIHIDHEGVKQWEVTGGNLIGISGNSIHLLGGTAALPGIAHASSPSSGIYFASTTSLAMSFGGTADYLWDNTRFRGVGDAAKDLGDLTRRWRELYILPTVTTSAATTLFVHNTTTGTLETRVMSGVDLSEFNDDIGAAGIGGSITNDQVAVGAATANDIEGTSTLTWVSNTLHLNSGNGAIEVATMVDANANHAIGFNITSGGGNNRTQYKSVGGHNFITNTAVSDIDALTININGLVSIPTGVAATLATQFEIVDESTGNYGFTWGQGTGSASAYQPFFTSRSKGSGASNVSEYKVDIADDTGVVAVQRNIVRQDDDTDIVNRVAYSWANNATTLFQIDYTGDMTLATGDMYIGDSLGVTFTYGKIRFGDGDTYFAETVSDDRLDLFQAGSMTMSFATTLARFGSASASPAIKYGVGTAANPSYHFDSDTDTGIWRPAADQLGISIGGTNRWTFGVTGAAYFGSTTTGAPTLAPGGAAEYTFTSDLDTGIGRGGTNILEFRAGGLAATIDANKNIGFGTADIESWDSTFRAIQSDRAAIMFPHTATNNHLSLLSNAYYDGAWKYRNTAEASKISQNSGVITFAVAPSGTLDTAITWSNVLSLQNNGNIGFNTTDVEAWDSDYFAIEGPQSSIYFSDLAQANDTIGMMSNAYYDGTWKYKTTNVATLWGSGGGETGFYSAASGTINTTITWVKALTLNTDSTVTIDQYGGGTNTGTATYALAVDSSGNIIEEALGAGSVGGTGADNQVAFWDGTGDIQGDTNLTYDGTTLTRDGVFIIQNGSGANRFNFQTNGIVRALSQNVWEPYNYSTADHHYNVGHATIGEFRWHFNAGTGTMTSDTDYMSLSRTELKMDTVLLNMNGKAINSSGTITSNTGSSFQLENNASTNTNPTLIPNRGSSNTGIGGNINNLSLIVTGTEVVKIDNSNNIGFNNTDIEAWGSQVHAIEGPTSAVVFASTSDSADSLQLASNAYFDGTNWKYKTTDSVAISGVYDGAFHARVAASGTIDTTITLINAFTIASTGKLNLGVQPTTGNTSDRILMWDATGEVRSIAGTSYTANTGTVTGTGATDRIATWSGTSSLDSDSLFTFNASTNSVGLGIATPDSVFHMLKTQNASTNLTIENLHAGTAAFSGLYLETDGGTGLIISHGTGRTVTRYGVTVGDNFEILTNDQGLLIGTGTGARDIVFGTNSNERLRITSAGQLDITTQPTVGSTNDRILVWDATGAVQSIDGLTYAVTSGTPVNNQVVLWNGTSSIDALAAGTNTHVLTMVGGIPAWAAPAGGGIGGSIGNQQVAFGSGTDIAGSSSLLWTGSILAVNGSVQGEAGSVYTVTDAATNTIPAATLLIHNSSATPINTFGVGMEFKAKTSTTVDTLMGSLNMNWSTAAHATRSAEFNVKLVDNAAGEVDRFTVGSTGFAQFFGTGGSSTVSTNGSYTASSTNTTNSQLSAITTNSISNAIILARVPTGGADPYILFNVLSTSAYSLGIDNSGSDAFKLNYNAGNAASPSSGTNFLSVSTAGLFTFGSNVGGGSSTSFLNAAGGWTTPAGGGGTVTGTGVNNRIATWSGTSSLDSDADLTYDGVTLTATVDGSPDENAIQIYNSSASTGYAQIGFGNVTTGTGASNGFLVGVNAAEQAVLRNIENTNMLFYTNGIARMYITNGGQLGYNGYGIGTHTGTAAKFLAVTSAGAVIEEDAPGGVSGTGVDNRIAMWNGTTAIDSRSDFYWDGTWYYMPTLRITNEVQFPANTGITDPSITCTTDDNTGFNFTGADQINIVVGGQNRGIMSTTNFDWNTSGGAYRVRLNGSTDGYLQIRNNSSVTTHQLHSNSGNWIGAQLAVGYTSAVPYSMYNIWTYKGTFTPNVANGTEAQNITPGIAIAGSGNRSSTTGIGLSFVLSSSTTVSTPTWEMARIVGMHGNSSTGNASGKMLLQTRSNASAYWHYNIGMTLDENGRVGINDHTPSYTLDVNGQISTKDYLRVWSTGDPRIWFDTIDGGTDWYIGMDDSRSDHLSFGEGSTVGTTTNVQFWTNGDVTFGTTGVASTSELWFDFLAADSTLHCEGNIIANSSSISSDIRLKENIKEITNEEALDVIMRLRPKTFNKIRKGDTLYSGFIAQEVEKVLSHLITESESLGMEEGVKYKHLNESGIIAYLTGAIQEVKEEKDKEIVSLRDEMAELKKLVNQLISK